MGSKVFSDPRLANVPRFMHDLENKRKELAPAEWRNFTCSSLQLRQWRYFLCHDPYTRWSFLKPRGYAGDATVMDFAYRHGSITHEVAASGNLGREIYSHTSSSPQSHSARMRIELIAAELNRFCGIRQNGGISVASYASGHGRELELLSEQAKNSISSFIAIDSDKDSLEELFSSSGNLPVHLMHNNVFRFNRKDEPHFDFIYSLGLFDYLEPKKARFLATRMWNALKPGGRMIIANLSHDAANIGYCEAIMDWWMVTRSQDDMSAILEDIPDMTVQSRCHIEQHGCFHYLTLDK